MLTTIDFPEWLPLLVRKRAQEVLAELVADKADEFVVRMIQRLTVDQRMKKVWNYLQKKRRVQNEKTTAYQFPARDSAANRSAVGEGFAARAEWIQQVGMRDLYEEIALVGFLFVPSHENERLPYMDIIDSESPILRAASTFRKKAKENGTWADEHLGRGHKASTARLRRGIRKILRAADDFESFEKIYLEETISNIRQQRDFVTSLVADKMGLIFGKPMYGQTATIASVLLDHLVTAEHARHCQRGWSGKKTA